jgi:hypothetical protein
VTGTNRPIPQKSSLGELSSADYPLKKNLQYGFNKKSIFVWQKSNSPINPAGGAVCDLYRQAKKRMINTRS